MENVDSMFVFSLDVLHKAETSMKNEVVGHSLSECEQSEPCRSSDLGLPKP